MLQKILVEYREAYGLTQLEAALKLQVPYTTYRYYERGRGEPKLQRVREMCQSDPGFADLVRRELDCQ